MSKKTVKKEDKVKETKVLQGLYKDFKGTMGDVLGDAGEVFKKNKVLVIIAFIAFLLYRNKQFSMSKLVKKVEDAIKGREFNEEDDF